jgi:leader peptidase (prepilin peptidase)/N-methyltransferase
MNMTTVYVTLAFVFGCVIGSFLNVCIARLPQGRSIVRPPSACPHCGAPIAWYDNIPLISFALLRARCRQCGEPISWRYPLVEAMAGILGALLMWRYGPGVSLGIYCLLGAALIAITFIDIDHQIIPNEISLPGIGAGFLLSFVNPDTGWIDSAIGIVVGGGFLLLVILVYWLVTKREGMGGGDVKLLAMIGAFLGVGGVWVTVLVASVVGTIVGLIVMIRKGDTTRMPIVFGPFLSLGAMTYVMIGGRLLARYLGTGLLFH